MYKNVVEQLELTGLKGASPLAYQSLQVDPPSPTRRRPKAPPENKFLLHLGLLLRKNYLVQLRSPKALLFQLLAPLLICFLIVEWQKIGDSKFTEIEIDSPIKQISGIERCYYTLEDPDNCLTIAYGILVNISLLKYSYKYLGRIGTMDS